MGEALPTRGRGAAENPANRFERLHYQPDGDESDRPAGAPPTEYLKDGSLSIIAHNDSPDVGFSASINPYRGCEHGCIYCYARPTHEYLGFSAGLDFETRILVKEDAPELLRAELAAPRWSPKVLAISGVTDCYQPIERRLQLTRRCLEVLLEFRNPFGIVTKNHLVTRDLDLLQQATSWQGCSVSISLTTLDSHLQQKLEPRASHPNGRLAAIKELSAAGVPVCVMAAPVIPGLTDHEIPALLEAAQRAGARYAGYTMLRLPFAVKDLFQEWLQRHFPQRAERVLSRVREVRGGKLNDARFASRMSGQGPIADAIRTLFDITCRKVGLERKGPTLSTEAFRRPQAQRQLFD